MTRRYSRSGVPLTAKRAGPSHADIVRGFQEFEAAYVSQVAAVGLIFAPPIWGVA